MNAAVDLLLARTALVTHARPSVSYCRALGLDWAEVEAAAGGLWVAPIATDGLWFDIVADGVEALVVEVFTEDAATTVDLVAWLPDQPGRWWRAVGGGLVLGEAYASNPNTGLCGEPLRIFQTPLGWLQGDCAGVVLLDPSRAGRWLLDTARTIAAEDAQHAGEIHRLMKAAGPKILVKARAA